MMSPPIEINYFICLATHHQLQHECFDGGHTTKLIVLDVPDIPDVELMCCFNHCTIDKVVLYPTNPSTPYNVAAACSQFYRQYVPPPPYEHAVESAPPRHIPPCDLVGQWLASIRSNEPEVQTISSDEDN